MAGPILEIALGIDVGTGGARAVVQEEVGGMGLQQSQKSLHIQPRLFQDVRQSGALEGPVCGDGDFEEFLPEVFLQAQVAPPLAND